MLVKFPQVNLMVVVNDGTQRLGKRAKETAAPKCIWVLNVTHVRDSRKPRGFCLLSGLVYKYINNVDFHFLFTTVESFIAVRYW